MKRLVLSMFVSLPFTYLLIHLAGWESSWFVVFCCGFVGYAAGSTLVDSWHRGE